MNGGHRVDDCVVCLMIVNLRPVGIIYICRSIMTFALHIFFAVKRRCDWITCLPPTLTFTSETE